MTIKKIICIMAVAACSLHNEAQAFGDTLSVKTEYENLVSHYANATEAASISGTIRIYDEEQNQLLKETSHFRYARNGRQFFMQLSYLQTFCNGNILLQLDTVNRVIIVNRVDSNYDIHDLQKRLFPADTAGFRLTGTVKEINGERQLSLGAGPTPGFLSASVWYDATSYRLRACEMRLWKNGLPGNKNAKKTWRTRIEYSYPPFTALTIDREIARVISIKDGRIIPVSRYKNYRVMGHV